MIFQIPKSDSTRKTELPFEPMEVLKAPNSLVNMGKAERNQTIESAPKPSKFAGGISPLEGLKGNISQAVNEAADSGLLVSLSTVSNAMQMLGASKKNSESSNSSEKVEIGRAHV